MIHRLSIPQLSVVVGGNQIEDQVEQKGANDKPFWTTEKVVLAIEVTVCLIYIASGFLYKEPKTKLD